MCVVLFYLSKTKKKAFVLFYLHLYHIPVHTRSHRDAHTYIFIHTCTCVYCVLLYTNMLYIYIYKCVRVCVFGNVTLQRIQEEKLENSPAFPCVLCLAWNSLFIHHTTSFSFSSGWLFCVRREKNNKLTCIYSFPLPTTASIHQRRATTRKMCDARYAHRCVACRRGRNRSGGANGGRYAYCCCRKRQCRHRHRLRWRRRQRRRYGTQLDDAGNGNVNGNRTTATRSRTRTRNGNRTKVKFAHNDNGTETGTRTTGGTATAVAVAVAAWNCNIAATQLSIAAAQTAAGKWAAASAAATTAA